MSPKTSRVFFRWHRRIGITSALFVLILSITGLLLMFSTSLGLDQKTWGGGLVSSVYNLEPKSEPVGIPITSVQGEQSWVVLVDGLVYIGSAEPISLNPPLSFAIQNDNFVLFGNDEEVVTTLEDGTLVERQSLNDVDVDNVISLAASDRMQIPDATLKRILDRYAGRGMPASRVLLDIHSGRFFGRLGTWLMGLAAILLILLSLSGIYMWTTTDVRRARRDKMKKELAKLRGGD